MQKQMDQAKDSVGFSTFQPFIFLVNSFMQPFQMKCEVLKDEKQHN